MRCVIQKCRVMTGCSVFLWTLLSASAAWGQSIISAHSGVVHYIEGAVTIDGTATNPKFGQFPDIKNGQILATEEGRAEILLTPGVFLRLAENSSVRMVSNALSDTRLELVSGSALIEVGELLENNALAISVKDTRITLPKKGLYRVDASPARLSVYDGQALLRPAGTDNDSDSKFVAKKGHAIELDDPKLADTKFDVKENDAFYRWSSRRSSYIATANVVSAKVASDSGYSSGFLGRSMWSWNPSFGMYTFLPSSGIYASPFGSSFLSPGAFSGMYSPGMSGFSFGNFGGHGGFGSRGVSQPAVVMPPSGARTGGMSTSPRMGAAGSHAASPHRR